MPDRLPVLTLVTEALDGHAGSGPETDLIELNPLDIGAAKEHRPHGAIADRQGFGHPCVCRSIRPQAQFSSSVRPARDSRAANEASSVIGPKPNTVVAREADSKK